MGFGSIYDIYFSSILSKEFFTASWIFIFSYLSLRIIKFIFSWQVKKFVGKTKNELDDILFRAIKNIKWPLLIPLSAYISLELTSLSIFVSGILLKIVVIVATYYSIKIAQDLVDFYTEKIADKRLKDEKVRDVSMIKNLRVISKGFIWIIAFLLILSNLGYDITTLIAGLGVGGVAIALALQNILEDVFSSLSIHFDKPFVLGDFIVIGDDLGSIEKIGIKTTRIRHLEGHELVVSNKELTNIRINNYGKMQKRRVSFEFGVEYETSVDKIRIINEIVKRVIEEIDLTTFDRCHFKKYGDFSLIFEVAYYISTSDYNSYMDIQQDINIAIKEAFDKEGIDFAYPTQTVYVNKDKSTK